MSISRLGGTRRSLMGVAILVLIVGVGSVVSGQPVPGGLPSLAEQILAAVNGLADQTGSVQTAIGELQSDVDALQESVNALAEVDEANVSSTAPVSLANEVLGCAVSNISDHTRTVRVQSFGGGGVPGFDSLLNLSPNTTTGIFSNPFFGTSHCRFTVVDGTSADIRASISVNNATGQRFAIAAQ